MEKLEHIELIIFDLDGTLVNSQFDLTDAVNFAMKEMDRPLIAIEQMPSMLGGGMRKLLELSLLTYTADEIKIARTYFDSYYTANYTNKTICYDGVEEMLIHFKDKTKVVYSNKIHKFTVDIINSLGLDKYFDLVIGADETLYQTKPSPEGIYYILDKLNVSAENTIMIGDSTHDIEASHSAGIKSGAVSYGYRPLNVLKEAKPLFVIDDISKLADFIHHKC